jgi:glycosyltransferase involved in cell wall biosynthesis
MNTASARPRLLFSYVTATSFVEDDLALLREHYDVETFRFDPERASSATGLARLWTRQCAWLLRELPTADLVYGWFADHHAALPVLLARWFDVPTAVVLGGMDCNWLPEYDYGVWESRWRAPLVRWVVRHADLLPTVSPSLVEAEERYSTWPERRRNGIRVHVPDLQTPHPVVPLGFRPDDWPMGPPQRPDTVTTVALIDSWRTFKIKGLDLFLAAARRLPAVSFRIVGVRDGFATTIRRDEDVPDNVALLPPRPRSALSDVYRETAVYAQLSRVEAFGLVVGEAMLSGCVPVVSAVGQPPELVGDTGEVVQRPDPDAIADALRRALGRGEEARTAARTRIENQFTMDQRRERLLGLLEELRQ